MKFVRLLLPQDLRRYLKVKLLKKDRVQENFLKSREQYFARVNTNQRQIQAGTTPASKTKSVTSLEPILGLEKQIGSITVDVDFLEPGANYSIDFWDTLVGRTIPAQNLRLGTALIASLRIWEREGFEAKRPNAYKLLKRRQKFEGRLNKRGVEAGLKEQIRCMLQNQDESFIDSVCEFEKESELRNSRILDSPLSEYIKTKHVTVISDFCQNSEDLRKILESKLEQRTNTDFVVSADFGVTKKSGKLFEFRLKSDKWIHIGDNPKSDYEMSHLAGAIPYLVRRNFYTVWNKQEFATPNQLAQDLRAHFGAKDAGKFLIDIASIGYGLVTSAMEAALMGRKNQVVYLSREGETLHRMHTLISKGLESRGIKAVPSIHLPVSRAAISACSFFPNLNDFFQGIQEEYGPSTPEIFASNLALPPNLSDLVIWKLEAIKKADSLHLLTQLDSVTLAKVTNHLENQRALFSRLLEQNEIDPQTSLVVDLGWRGTIQSALSRFFEESFQGHYLGLYPKRSTVESIKATALLFDTRRFWSKAPDYLNLPGPLERSFTVAPNQVINFKEDSSGDVSFVTSNIPDGPSEERLHIMSKFEPTVSMISETLIDAGIFGFDSKRFVSETLRMFYLAPTRVHANTWFGERHREGFGNSTWHTTDLSESGRAVGVEKFLEQTRWPAGWIAYDDNLF